MAMWTVGRGVFAGTPVSAAAVPDPHRPHQAPRQAGVLAGWAVQPHSHGLHPNRGEPGGVGRWLPSALHLSEGFCIRYQ
ncbi:hypothetical protein SKAU_G00129480 [Synaphobranchus kaupii]|uniref:Uncharacterized protein n=1 Tax=Synaphobranchus kaupii TaxID=118154 RepID=A0A9Q1FQ89_SYNKA|nr:hypothetical protein SKAU_G00129480 [Synaphobranchus kaupii]